MHITTVAKGLNLTKSHSNTHSDLFPPTPEPTTCEAHNIRRITTLEEFEQTLTDCHHRHVVIFCVTSTYKDPDHDEVGWYHHYERLNDVRFVRVDLDLSDELKERLNPKVQPCWVTFYKRLETGWISGGMKRFMQMHSERKGSH